LALSVLILSFNKTLDILIYLEIDTYYCWFVFKAALKSIYQTRGRNKHIILTYSVRLPLYVLRMLFFVHAAPRQTFQKVFVCPGMELLYRVNNALVAMVYYYFMLGN
jgi:hypothetical protein